MKKWMLLLATLSIVNSTPIFSNQMPGMMGSSDPQLQVNNMVLTKVNDTPISLLDVSKKMDLFFHSTYPDLADNDGARYQFYVSSWKYFLKEMITEELMKADAKAKEVTVSDGDLREEMESRFGPNIMISLEKMGLTFDEAWKMLENEMIVNKMQGHYIYSKAQQTIHPQAIREEYRQYCVENPTVEQWQYQMVSVRGASEKVGEEAAQRAYDILSQGEFDPISMNEKLKDVEKEFPEAKLQISKEYKVNSKEISTTHRSVLSNTKKNSFHPPVSQKSRTSQEVVHRIFFLKDYEKNEVASFDTMSEKMRDRLFQKAINDKTTVYHDKLMKEYGYESKQVDEMIPKDFVPFALK